MRTIELYKQHFVTKIMYKKKKTIVLKYWPGKQKGVGSNPIKTVFFFSLLFDPSLYSGV